MPNSFPHKNLPIDSLLPKIVETLAQKTNLILQASPGSGKTTRVPPALLKSLSQNQEAKEIWVLVPRRLAAKTAACRVAEELGEDVGETVGYHFRFEKKRSSKTRILFLTEGLFLRLFIQDPTLRQVQVVILDEFHERHLHTDVSLALVRDLQKTKRPDLKLLVMSATLDTKKLEPYLAAQTLSLDTPIHPITLEYWQTPKQTSAARHSLEAQVSQAISQVLLKTTGDILVFLPGMAEIRRVENLLLEKVKDVVVLALHGDLPREEQDLIFQKITKKKVILATNIAESSLTIPGVSVVIDSGLHRQASHDAWTGVPTLKTKPISQASAIQRMGRAGRTGPGHCLRLYSQSDFEGRIPFEKPEIARSDLAQTFLELGALGYQEDLEWFEVPPASAVNAAQTLLYRLGAVKKLGENGLTGIGRQMAQSSLHPRLSRLLLEVSEAIRPHAIRLAALISEDELKDLNTLHDLDQKPSFVVKKLEMQLGQKSEPSPMTKKQTEALAQAVLKAFPDRVAQINHKARQKERKSEMVFCTGGSAHLPETHERFEYAVIIDVWERQNRMTVHALVPIQADWLLNLENDFLHEAQNIFWDNDRKAIVATEELKYGELVLSVGKGHASAEAKAVLFLKEGLGLTLPITRDRFFEKMNEVVSDNEVESILSRIELLRKYQKADLPELEESTLTGLAHYLVKDCDRLSDFQEKNILEEVVSFFSEKSPDLRQKLHQLAPTSLALSAQRKAKIHYRWNQDPWVESKLQDFLGMREGPKIMNGHLPLTLHLLAPNRRPVQVTRDLASFWKNTYPQVRKELSRKYPRHPWPENV